jgi:NADPH2:quinone reductase
VKALLSIKPGGPETLVLSDVQEPQPREGQVRIRVRACSINYPDVLLIQDLYQAKPQRPFVPGGDVAGVIDAIGAGVKHLKIGDRVLAGAGMGGLAQSIVTDAAICFRIPNEMEFDTASALVTTYGTSYYALHHRARLQTGETLLVLGASGGVGLAAVELGRTAGARVIAAASSQAKLEVALRAGADAGIVYSRGPLDKQQTKSFTEQIKGACGPQGVDVVYDAVGGTYSEAALRSIAWEGRFLVVGFPAGIGSVPLNLPLLKSCQIVGVFWGAAASRSPQLQAAQYAELMALYKQGEIHPLISQRLPLDRGGEAIAALAGRQAVGKIVVVME